MADDVKDGVIAMSPIVDDRSEMPHRIVIRDIRKQFVVHTQCLPRNGDKPYYLSGNYFPYGMFSDGDDRTAALRKAYTCFDRRARRSLHIGLEAES
jgi:hypothetical protein